MFSGDKLFLVTSPIGFSSDGRVVLSPLPVIDDLASILPSGKTHTEAHWLVSDGHMQIDIKVCDPIHSKRFC